MAKNLLLVCLDGARADMIADTKELSHLFKKGTLFDQCIVSSPYTVASIHSIMTGMYGHKNGVDAYNNMFKLKNNLKTLPEYLNENNYFTHADMLGEAVLSNRGFDEWTIHDENSLTSNELLNYHKEIVSKANAKSQNFFVFFQYSKIHTGCVANVAKKFDDLDEQYYTALQVQKNRENFSSYMKDAGIYASGLVEHLTNLNILDDTLVVFFSDHGTSLGEKFGEKMYGSFVYDYTIKTFFHFLNYRFPNLKIREQIRCIDIMPTILELLGIEANSQMLDFQGESLMPLIAYHKKNRLQKYFIKEPKDRIAYVETGGLGGPWPSPKKPNVFCVRTKKWKLIHNLTPDNWELYNLVDDPSEKINLVKQYPEVKDKLIKHIKIIEYNYK
tara:strand:+ start:21012 stop:22172 length:1161 start_codon:yes stop_codon:yes gene_type:complete